MLALEAIGITKRYGGLVALSDGRLSLQGGEVHVLMGSNGCGKSTLCKVIAGAISADSGEVRLRGGAVSFRNPHEAKAAGIATVYQEMSLVPTLSVAENVLLGAEPRNALGFVDAGSRRDAVRRLIAAVGPLGEGLDPHALVGDLPVDKRQIVEILKALAPDPAILLFDESTSSLDKSQVDAFFSLVRTLKARGRSIIFISHRLEEIFAIGDRVTVMRNGATVATLPLAETSKDEIVGLMVGGARSEAAARQAAKGDGPVLLEVRGLTGQRLSDCTFDLRAGEVLGLGGLHGQGQSDLLLTLFGARPATAGEVRHEGRPLKLSGPRAALRRGLAYVSGDRGRAGALAGRPIVENVSLAMLAKGAAHFVSRAALQARVRPIMERLKVRFGGYARPLSSLSGGNQQKVILGRALATQPRIFLLDDPTKGIDVEAKRDLYALIAEIRREGAAVILYSSEDAELLENADRVLVFNGGRIVEEIGGDRLTEFNLYSAALKSAA